MFGEPTIAYLAYAVGLYLCYLATIVWYRLNRHPLASIPGPRLAKITYLYEWYHDLYHLGQFPWKIKELHEEYGPIVRITPDEVHIKDPDFIAKLYSRSNGRADKPPRAAETFGPFPAAISTASHAHHRLRRSALNPFFSRKSVSELVPAMTHAIDILCERLQEVSKTGELVNLKYVFAAVTSDIIDDYCFARKPTKILLKDFGRKFFDDIDSFLEVSLLNFHIPTIMRLSFAFPDWLNKLLAPRMAAMLDFRQDLGRQIDEIRHGKDKAHEGVGHRTVLHELLGSSLPPDELKTPRLRDEAFSLMVAGSGTTAYTLRATTYHIASNPLIRQKLHAELLSAIPDPTNPPPNLLATLEKLPYLTAVIHEGLRLSEPVTNRLPRIFPDKTLAYALYALPPGTIVSMTGSLTHSDPTIFPEPYTFNPDRRLAAITPRRFVIQDVKGMRRVAIAEYSVLVDVAGRWRGAGRRGSPGAVCLLPFAVFCSFSCGFRWGGYVVSFASASASKSRRARISWLSSAVESTFTFTSPILPSLTSRLPAVGVGCFTALHACESGVQFMAATSSGFASSSS